MLILIVWPGLHCRRPGRFFVESENLGFGADIFLSSHKRQETDCDGQKMSGDGHPTDSDGHLTADDDRPTKMVDHYVADDDHCM